MKSIVLCFALAFATPLTAQDRVTGIETTIQSQIDAFLNDDFVTAFTFASPNIQRIFGTADRFGVMVKNGFPMVHRPSDVEFVEIRRQGTLLFQKVKITDANGIPHFMEYNMIETSEGWQIDGVELLRAPPVGA